MPAPSDPPKQYMRLRTNSQRPAPVMLLSGAFSSHTDPPAVPDTGAMADLLSAVQPSLILALPVVDCLQDPHAAYTGLQYNMLKGPYATLRVRELTKSLSLCLDLSG